MKKILCFGDSNTFGFILNTELHYSAIEHNKIAESMYELIKTIC